MTSFMQRHHGRLLRLCALADQAGMSIATFLMVGVLARFAPPELLADYGVALAFALVVVGVARSVVLTPMAMLKDRAVNQRTGTILSVQQGFLGVLLVLEAIFMAGWWLVMQGMPGWLILVPALTLLQAQHETARILLLKRRQALPLLLPSLCFLSVTACLVVPLRRNVLDATGLASLLGIYGVTAFFVTRRLAGPCRWPLALRLLRILSARHMGWATLGSIAYAGYAHVPLVMLGAQGNALATASFVVSRSLMQPVNLIVRSLDSVDKSQFRQAVKSHDGGVNRMAARQTAFYATIAGTLSLGMALLSSTLLPIAFGPKYSGLEGLVLAWAAVAAVQSALLPLETLLYYKRLTVQLNLVVFVTAAGAMIMAPALITAWSALGAVLVCLACCTMVLFGAGLLVNRSSTPA